MNSYIADGGSSCVGLRYLEGNGIAAMCVGGAGYMTAGATSIKETMPFRSDAGNFGKV